jgi:uncharacterized protein
MSDRKRSIINSIWRLLVVYAVFCLIVFLVQRSLLYFPSHEEPVSALSPWLVEGNVVGYCREVPNPKNVWLMLHGNAGQASDRDYALGRLEKSDSLYVLEYPGYGQRPGSPNRVSFDSAAMDAYEWLATRFPTTPLCVIGESIGSGPASGLASASRSPDRIVLVVPYDKLSAVAGRRFFFLPVSWMLLDNWDNIHSLQNYQGPVDIFGARDDHVIPCSHAKNLAQQIRQANFHEIPCGHNDWWRMPKVKIRHEPEFTR